MSLRKYLLISSLGFGVGGVLWGLEAYRGTVGSGEVFTNPFSYILGAVALGVFGGHALAYATKEKGISFGWRTCFGCLSDKRTLKIIGLGIVGWLVAFFLPAVWVDWWLVVGSIITSFIILIIKITGFDVVLFMILKPSLVVGQLWFHFLLTGLVISSIYGFVLKTKIIRVALWGAGGFALASLIGPILGNLIGNLFGSLLVSYLVTFFIIGVGFGKFFIFGIRRSL